MASDDACRVCQKALTPHFSVKLWDGKRYCRDCVEAVCSGLADYAASHDSLEETPRLRVVDCLRFTAFLLVILTGLCGVLCALLIIAPSELEAIDLLAVSGFLAALCMVTVIMFLLLVILFKTTITAKDGFITQATTMPLLKKARSFRPTPSADTSDVKVSNTWNLQDCRWYVGKGRGLYGFVAPGEPKVVLRVPVVLFGIRIWWRTSVICGFSAESRRLWKGFLTLAGVPKDPSR